MTQPPPSLAEFLLDRIVEDEAQARLRMHHAQQNYLMLQEPNLLGRVIPGWGEWPAIEAFAGRVLAEREAKRRIVAEHRTDGAYPDGALAFATIVKDGAIYNGGIVPGCRVCVEHHADMDCTNKAWPCDTLRLLALPYADHPDFDPRWRS